MKLRINRLKVNDSLEEKLMDYKRVSEDTLKMLKRNSVSPGMMLTFAKDKHAGSAYTAKTELRAKKPLKDYNKLARLKLKQVQDTKKIKEETDSSNESSKNGSAKLNQSGVMDRPINIDLDQNLGNRS